jgi:hypothetical protein
VILPHRVASRAVSVAGAALQGQVRAAVEAGSSGGLMQRVTRRGGGWMEKNSVAGRVGVASSRPTRVEVVGFCSNSSWLGYCVRWSSPPQPMTMDGFFFGGFFGHWF